MNIIRVDNKEFPYIDGNTIFVPVYNTSAVIVNTPSFVVFNHLDWVNGANVSWWFLIEADGIITRLKWEQLVPTQQVQVRTGVMARKEGISFRAELFPYNDERCYVLEALSAN